jgi:hypothetical protein
LNEEGLCRWRGGDRHLHQDAPGPERRARGFRFEEGGTLLTAPVRVAEGTAALGPQELVVLAVKGPSLPGLAPRGSGRCGPGRPDRSCDPGAPHDRLRGARHLLGANAGPGETRLRPGPEGNEVAVEHQKAQLALCVELAQEVLGGL